MFDPGSVRVRGPVQVYVRGFWTELERQGFRPLSILRHLRLLAHLGRWLEAKGLAVRDLTDERAIAFVRHRARLGHTALYSARAVEPMLSFLRSIGAVPVAVPAVDESPVERFVGEYAAYLVRGRGLAATTVHIYTVHVRRFVEEERPRLDWSRLTGAEVSRFLLRSSRRKGMPTCIQIVSALRSLLRYLHVRGAVAAHLASSVQPVARWRLSGIPKALDASQISRLLASFDDSCVGLRNAAIVLLLLRLGLRAGEVAALDLDDVSWRTGELVVRGKGRRESRLPLPRDVGQAVAAYLRHGRPSVSTRGLFVRARAPFTRLTMVGISHSLQRRLRHLGVPWGGAHVLRHTAATQLLRRGSSLPEIAHVLRHRHIDTTAIYAKVDLAGLAELARPWPGSAP
jgi:site-specific recombinase XerD